MSEPSGVREGETPRPRNGEVFRGSKNSSDYIIDIWNECHPSDYPLDVRIYLGVVGYYFDGSSNVGKQRKYGFGSYFEEDDDNLPSTFDFPTLPDYSLRLVALGRVVLRAVAKKDRLDPQNCLFLERDHVFPEEDLQSWPNYPWLPSMSDKERRRAFRTYARRSAPGRPDWLFATNIRLSLGKDLPDDPDSDSNFHLESAFAAMIAEAYGRLHPINTLREYDWLDDTYLNAQIAFELSGIVGVRLPRPRLPMDPDPEGQNMVYSEEEDEESDSDEDEGSDIEDECGVYGYAVTDDSSLVREDASLLEGLAQSYKKASWATIEDSSLVAVDGRRLSFNQGHIVSLQELHLSPNEEEIIDAAFQASMMAEWFVDSPAKAPQHRGTINLLAFDHSMVQTRWFELFAVAIASRMATINCTTGQVETIRAVHVLTAIFLVMCIHRDYNACRQLFKYSQLIPQELLPFGAFVGRQCLSALLADLLDIVTDEQSYNVKRGEIVACQQLIIAHLAACNQLLGASRQDPVDDARAIVWCGWERDHRKASTPWERNALVEGLVYGSAVAFSMTGLEGAHALVENLVNTMIQATRVGASRTAMDILTSPGSQPDDIEINKNYVVGKHLQPLGSEACRLLDIIKRFILGSLYAISQLPSWSWGIPDDVPGPQKQLIWTALQAFLVATHCPQITPAALRRSQLARRVAPTAIASVPLPISSGLSVEITPVDLGLSHYYLPNTRDVMLAQFAKARDSHGQKPMAIDVPISISPLSQDEPLYPATYSVDTDSVHLGLVHAEMVDSGPFWRFVSAISGERVTMSVLEHRMEQERSQPDLEAAETILTKSMLAITAMVIVLCLREDTHEAAKLIFHHRVGPIVCSDLLATGLGRFIGGCVPFWIDVLLHDADPTKKETDDDREDQDRTLSQIANLLAASVDHDLATQTPQDVINLLVEKTFNVANGRSFSLQKSQVFRGVIYGATMVFAIAHYEPRVGDWPDTKEFERILAQFLEPQERVGPENGPSVGPLQDVEYGSPSCSIDSGDPTFGLKWATQALLIFYKAIAEDSRLADSRLAKDPTLLAKCLSAFVSSAAASLVRLSPGVRKQILEFKAKERVSRVES